MFLKLIRKLGDRQERREVEKRATRPYTPSKPKEPSKFVRDWTWFWLGD